PDVRCRARKGEHAPVSPRSMSMTDKNHSSAGAILEGSTLMQKGRADVLRVRRRTWIKRVVRAIVTLGAIDGYLWYRFASHRPLVTPSLPPEWPMFLPVFGLFVVIILMAALPL